MVRFNFYLEMVIYWTLIYILPKLQEPALEVGSKADMEGGSPHATCHTGFGSPEMWTVLINPKVHPLGWESSCLVEGPHF